MKPYWQSSDGLITIYHGDMLEVLPRLRVDVVVADAPFGIGDKPLGARRAGKRWAGIKLQPSVHHAPSDWDHELDPAWCSTVCEAAPVVAWFGSWKRRANVEAAMPYPIRAEIIWAKDVHVGPPCPAAMRDERIWIFARAVFKGQHFETTVWDEPIIPTWQHRWHKNQKPLPLMGRLIRWVAPPEAVGADPFMGSGSTLVAALQLGRRWIGIDKDEGHCASAVQRLSGARREAAVGPLFGGERC